MKNNIKKIFPFSDTHKESILNFNKYKINIFQGAVRSGKTYLANMLFLKYIKNRKGKIIMSGHSSDTIKKNVISDFENYLGCKIFFKNNNFGQYFTINKEGYKELIFYVVGGGKNGDEAKVQGLEVLFWYADEVSTYAKPFFDMMLTRLSRQDSKALFTLNPASPTHWLKKWIDENTDINSLNYVENYVYTRTYKLTDNYSLPKEYIEQISKSLKGVMYNRLVLGKWAIGEGLIYSVDNIKINDNKKELEDFIINNRAKLTIGVDLGTIHPSAFILVAKVKNTYYVMEEYYKQKVAPSELAKDLVKFYNNCIDKYGYYNIDIKYDHAAAWFATEFCLINKTITLQKAKKDVLKGIMNIEHKINNGNLVISQDCKNLINELNGYSWDEKNDNSPIKLNDDACDALRYAIFSNDYDSSTY